jgi:hypothetical protein
MSLVLAYSMVAFQCLRVWKWILSIRSFFSLLATFFRWILKVLEKCLCEHSNGLGLSCGRLFSIMMSRIVILSWRGSLPFSGVILTVLFSKSKSVHWSMKASPQRMPVSLSSCRNVAVFLLHPAIRLFSSSSVGMKGSFLTDWYIGFFQGSPWDFIRQS